MLPSVDFCITTIIAILYISIIKIRYQSYFHRNFILMILFLYISNLKYIGEVNKINVDKLKQNQKK